MKGSSSRQKRKKKDSNFAFSASEIHNETTSEEQDMTKYSIKSDLDQTFTGLNIAILNNLNFSKLLTTHTIKRLDRF